MIDSYVAELAQRLPRAMRTRDRVLEEVREHLLDAAAEEGSEERAVERFGRFEDVAKRLVLAWRVDDSLFRLRAGTTIAALGFAAIATVFIVVMDQRAEVLLWVPFVAGMFVDVGMRVRRASRADGLEALQYHARVRARVYRWTCIGIVWQSAAFSIPRVVDAFARRAFGVALVFALSQVAGIGIVGAMSAWWYRRTRARVERDLSAP